MSETYEKIEKERDKLRGELNTLREQYRWRHTDDALPELARLVEWVHLSTGERFITRHRHEHDQQKWLSAWSGSYWRYCDDGPEEG